jgi:uncharacterized protein YukE
MTAVERLAREMALIYGCAKGVDAIPSERSWREFIEDAHALLSDLQAPQRALIDRWHREADALEEQAVKHYGVDWLGDGDKCTQLARELRRRASEVERCLGAAS